MDLTFKCLTLVRMLAFAMPGFAAGGVLPAETYAFAKTVSDQIHALCPVETTVGIQVARDVEPAVVSLKLTAEWRVLGSKDGKRSWLLCAGKIAGQALNRNPNVHVDEVWFADTELARKDHVLAIPAANLALLQAKNMNGSLSLDGMYAEFEHHLVEKDIARPPRASIAPEESAALDGLLEQLFFIARMQHRNSPAGVLLMLNETTLGAGYNCPLDWVTVLRNESDHEEEQVREAVEDFIVRNQEPAMLKEPRNLGTPVRLISRAELHEVSDPVAGRDGWGPFYAKYPTAFGYNCISRIGLSRNRSVAVVYREEHVGDRYGSGQFLILRRVFGRWTIQMATFGWNWIS